MVPSLMLVIVLVGPNYLGAAQEVNKDLAQETLMAQKAATPPVAQEAITPLITKDLAGGGSYVQPCSRHLSAEQNSAG